MSAELACPVPGGGVPQAHGVVVACGDKEGSTVDPDGAHGVHLAAVAGEDRLSVTWFHGCPDGSVRRRVRELRGHTDMVNAVCSVVVNGRTLLATASSDQTVRLWDPLTGSSLLKITLMHPVTAVDQVGDRLAISLKQGITVIHVSVAGHPAA